MGMESTCIGDFEHGIEPEHWLPRVEPATQSKAMSLLKQDVSHARRIREYEDQAKDDQVRIAKLEGALRLAIKVLVDGDQNEREQVAKQIHNLKIGGPVA